MASHGDSLPAVVPSLPASRPPRRRVSNQIRISAVSVFRVLGTVGYTQNGDKFDSAEKAVEHIILSHFPVEEPAPH
jgi:hypothetical protein